MFGNETHPYNPPSPSDPPPKPATRSLTSKTPLKTQNAQHFDINYQTDLDTEEVGIHIRASLQDYPGGSSPEAPKCWLEKSSWLALPSLSPAGTGAMGSPSWNWAKSGSNWVPKKNQLQKCPRNCQLQKKIPLPKICPGRSTIFYEFFVPVLYS